MAHFGTSERRRLGSTKTRRTLERILRWRCWRFASFGVSLAETTTAPTIVNKDIPSSVSKFLLKHPSRATPFAAARHQNQGFRVWPRHPMPCDGALPPPSSTRARTTPTADSAAIKIIPSSSSFKSPNSSRHRRHPCPTSHPFETSSNARGAHPPREDEDEDRCTTRTGQDERYVPLAVALPGRRASTETFTRALNAAVLVAVTANILRSVRDCEWRMGRVGETLLDRCHSYCTIH